MNARVNRAFSLFMYYRSAGFFYNRLELFCAFPQRLMAPRGAKCSKRLIGTVSLIL
jgi:hypothetical protein